MFEFNKGLRVEALELPHKGEQPDLTLQAYLLKLCLRSESYESAAPELQSWILKALKQSIVDKYNNGAEFYKLDMAIGFNQDEELRGYPPIEGDDFIESIKFIRQDVECLERQTALITFRKTLEEIENESR